MQLVKKQKPFQEKILNKFQHYLLQKGISSFLPIHVDHCPQSFAVVVKHKQGIKISYSGDCRPSKQFCQAAKHSTLMIHEATFTDDYHSKAIKNKHCTVSQAIDIAINSQSWKLALTHFSNRNNDTRQILTPKAYKGDKRNYAINHTFVCFDHLRMKMSQLPGIVEDAKRINSIYAQFSDEN